MIESGEFAPYPAPGSTSVMLLDLQSSKDFSLADVMKNLGFQISASFAEPDSQVEQIEQALKASAPSLVFVSLPHVDDTQLALIKTLQPEQLPCVVFSETASTGITADLMALGVSAFVVGDYSPEKIQHATSVAMARFAYTKKLVKGLAQTQEKLEQRKTIDRAKGLLMDKRGMSESEAYHALRRVAMNSGQPMAAIAQSVLDSQALMV